MDAVGRGCSSRFKKKLLEIWSHILVLPPRSPMILLKPLMLITMHFFGFQNDTQYSHVADMFLRVSSTENT